MPEKKDFNKVKKLYSLPLDLLIEQARQSHKKYFKTQKIQASKLLSIKTGACPEDCSYCSQSARYQTGVKRESLMELSEVVKQARQAQQEGASRFCMGAAWREVRSGGSFDKVLEMVKEVSSLGLEVCCTLGMLNLEQAKKLKEAGLYAYNHNIDTSREYYDKIITTRKYDDRLKTLDCVRKAGLTVCTGGILGLGESHQDRISFITELFCIKPWPESITINTLVPMPGTPLENQKPISPLDVIRVIAVCRILMKTSYIRLSAGRKQMQPTEQFICFFAGANSIFLGDKLLTAENPNLSSDKDMLDKIDMSLSKPYENLHV